ncbi:MAG: phosphatidate cytidylyltransferase [Proteobacteria bacterium]|nr:phosphatidate cytidylyltransferase [Pseudomonadota bacterium]
MLENDSGFLKRTLSIGFLIPFTLGILIYGPPLTTLLVGALLVGFSYEWLKMGHIQTKIEKGLFYGVLLGSEVVFLKWGLKESLAFLLGLSAFSYYILRNYGMKKVKREKNAEGKSGAPLLQRLTHDGWIFWGLLYIGVPCLSFLWIFELEQGCHIILWMLFIIWASDIGAYLIGSWLKGPKIAPTISPKKTWSGFLGGVCAGESVGILSGNFFGFDFKGVLGVSLGVVLCAVFGDLLESYLKRRKKVKDSGNIIPGHGGLFDRLDSTLAALPFITLILWLTKGDFFK